jgi:hypothetical protein
MNRSFKTPYIIFACASLLVAQSGCQQLGSLFSSTHFNQSAYDTDKEIKGKSLALINRAKDRARYTVVAADVDQLMQKIDNAISREQSRKRNVPTVEQWKRVRTELSHFFDLWKTKGTLSPTFVDDAKKQTSDFFDILIKTEEDKRRRS